MNKKGLAPIALIIAAIVALGIFVVSTGGESLQSASVVQANSCPAGTQAYCSSLTPNSVYQCKDGTTTKYNCPEGQSCLSGKCVNPRVDTCPTGTESNYCSAIDPTSYFRCIAGATYKYPCPSGSLCSGNECKPEVSQQAKCPSGTETPYCSASDSNAYFQCTNGVTKKYSCSSGQYCDGGKCVSKKCPSGTTQPYCSSQDPAGYYQCKDGVVNHYKCSGSNEMCVTGIGCFTVNDPADCKEPLSAPYCSALSPDNYYRKCGQVTFKYDCRDNYKCTDGDKCFYQGVFPSGDTIGDVAEQIGESAGEFVGSTTKSVVDGFFKGVFGDTFYIIGWVILGVILIVLGIYLIPPIVTGAKAILRI